MGIPASEHFEIQDIAGAGRGVIASTQIPVGTTVLDSESPVAHVIFRQYRKEVCAHCFEYDRGRTLPIRSSDTGKVFCSTRCQSRWLDQQGEIGLEAWKALHSFMQAKSKFVVDQNDVSATTTKPERAAVDSAWTEAQQQAQQWSLSTSTASKKQRKVPQAVDPDILAFLLSGILFHHQHPTEWHSDLLLLAMDETPYRSSADLEAHCNSFVQLAGILSDPLRQSCSGDVCHTLAKAASHNAFGIRSGSEDGEEYMGYAVYPGASYFNHSCTPNILKRRVGRCWEFMAARTIEKGEECCITYLGGDEKDLSVAERRARLEAFWGFECACRQCALEGGP